MPYGFQCFDEESGLLTFEVTDKLTRVIGMINPNGNSDVSGSVTVSSADMAGGSLFIFAFNNTTVSSWNMSSREESIVIKDNIITYTNINYPVMYGVY